MLAQTQLAGRRSSGAPYPVTSLQMYGRDCIIGSMEWWEKAAAEIGRATARCQRPVARKGRLYLTPVVQDDGFPLRCPTYICRRRVVMSC